MLFELLTTILHWCYKRHKLKKMGKRKTCGVFFVSFMRSQMLDFMYFETKIFVERENVGFN